ncbi:retrovirus-related pol polyprotein from transposon TNT 1-94 [Tanacetum coccineum]
MFLRVDPESFRVDKYENDKLDFPKKLGAEVAMRKNLLLGSWKHGIYIGLLRLLYPAARETLEQVMAEAFSKSVCKEDSSVPVLIRAHICFDRNRLRNFGNKSITSVISRKDNGEEYYEVHQRRTISDGTVSDVIVEELRVRYTGTSTHHQSLYEHKDIWKREDDSGMVLSSGQPNNDPLALVSDASVQQYPTQSSKSPQSSTEPYPSDNFQMNSGSSSTENLIESLSNSLALLTQSYKSHLPQTNNQLRASSNARNKAMVQDGKVVVQDVRGRYNANNQGRPFQRNNARGNGVAGNVGGQNRGGIINPGQAKPIKCYNYNGLGHIARECPRPKRLQDSDYFKDKMLLMQAQESGAVLDEEQSLFLAGEQVTNVDDNVDDSPENDLALNVDHVFEADECDAFDSDVDEGPITQTMFMTNLTSEDLIYDEAGTSYDSNTPSEVHDHDTFVNHLDEYHEVHEMQTDEQHNYVVDSDADYTSNSNTIPYDQYMEDNEDHVVQRDVSSVRNDALMSILDEMHEQGVQSRLANKPDMVVNDSVTSELARYKELVGEYEKRAKFELTDRERKIDEQMRIIISDRNRKETSHN